MGRIADRLRYNWPSHAPCKSDPFLNWTDMDPHMGALGHMNLPMNWIKFVSTGYIFQSVTCIVIHDDVLD